MATVKVGSARIDERGKITGGKAGDQTKNEVSTQAWYRHSKGWRVFRPKDPKAAEKIAKCMQMACNNQNIGYDQNSRNSLYTAAKPYDFDVSKVTKKVETDCSALVRVCCAYAGIKLPDFNTSSEASALLKSGAFTELTANKYRNKSDYLRRGDVLVTKTKGHTLVILSNGPKAEAVTEPEPEFVLGDRVLQNGMEGSDVKEFQNLLISLGYSCGDTGADSDFGDSTQLAVERFQEDNGLPVTGEGDKATIEALLKAQGEDKPAGAYTMVKIVGGNCFVRVGPGTDNPSIGVAYKGDKYEFLQEVSTDGWNKIRYNETPGWVSGMYSKLI